MTECQRVMIRLGLPLPAIGMIRKEGRLVPGGEIGTVWKEGRWWQVQMPFGVMTTKILREAKDFAHHEAYSLELRSGRDIEAALSNARERENRHSTSLRCPCFLAEDESPYRR